MVLEMQCLASLSLQEKAIQKLSSICTVAMYLQAYSCQAGYDIGPALAPGQH